MALCAMRTNRNLPPNAERISLYVALAAIKAVDFF